jgi:hypothetical protein
MRGRASRRSRNLWHGTEGDTPIYREAGAPGDERAYLRDVASSDDAETT